MLITCEIIAEFSRLAFILKILQPKSVYWNTVPRCRLSTYGCRAFYYAGPVVWNSLPDELRNSDSFDSFKRFLADLGRAFGTLCRPSVCRLSVCLSVSFCIQAKRLDRFAWNFQGRCGLTMGRPDYILGQFGETARCRDTNFFLSNITTKRLILPKRLDRFVRKFQRKCGLTMGPPDYI